MTSNGPSEYQESSRFDRGGPWAVVVAALALYALALGGLGEVAGVVALSLAIPLSGAAGAGGGVRAGLVVAFASLALGWYFAARLGLDSPQHLPSAMIVALASLAFGGAAGWARHLVVRNRNVRRELEREVDARLQTEASLNESVELHRNLVASLGEGVGLFDAQDRFLFANAAAERLCGAEPGALVGKTLSELLGADAQRKLRAYHRRATRGSVSYDLHIAQPTPKVVLVTETRIEAATPREAKTLRVLRDVTARAKLEQEQRDLEVHVQRTQALQSLAVLAGGVAHDFNNLLSGVMGNAELALLRLAEAPSDARACLEEIRQFATEASDLSRQMLAYAGRRGLSLEPVRLDEEVREALRLLHSTIIGKARLELELPRDLPPIRADRVQMRQVVTNLVLNALEAMEGERGQLKLNLRVDDLDDGKLGGLTFPRKAAAGTYLVLSVSDTGSGMSGDVAPRIFEPFYSTKFAGRGMGLAATLGIVKAHRGAISVSSDEGQGSTFRVLLPIAHQQREAREAASPMGVEANRGATLLLVDDEDGVRRVTARLLDELGYRVLTASSGKEALRRVEQDGSQIELVVLDMTMPEQSGAEVLQELLALRPELRVVLTSGFNPEDAADLLSKPGVVGFLPKPHTISGLEEALHRGLAAGRA